METVCIFITVLLSVSRLTKESLADVDIISKPDDKISIGSACFPIGSKCDRHEECCSKACLTYLHKCVSSLYASDENSNQTEQVETADKDMIDSRSNATKEEDDLMKKDDCTGLGKFCTGHKDCCTGACHSYLHKCVTTYKLQDGEETQTDTVEEIVTSNATTEP